jgi:hypothetical protein
MHVFHAFDHVLQTFLSLLILVLKLYNHPRISHGGHVKGEDVLQLDPLRLMCLLE